MKQMFLSISSAVKRSLLLAPILIGSQGHAQSLREITKRRTPNNAREKSS
jgi:hypothetical protein